MRREYSPAVWSEATKFEDAANVLEGVVLKGA
jgi:hypothetical protein